MTIMSYKTSQNGHGARIGTVGTIGTPGTTAKTMATDRIGIVGTM